MNPYVTVQLNVCVMRSKNLGIRHICLQERNREREGVLDIRGNRGNILVEVNVCQYSLKTTSTNKGEYDCDYLPASPSYGYCPYSSTTFKSASLNIKFPAYMAYSKLI